MGDDEVAGGLELVFRQGGLAFLLAVEMPAVLIMSAGVLPYSDAGFLCVKRVIHAGFLPPRRYGFHLRGGGAGNQQGNHGGGAGDKQVLHVGHCRVSGGGNHVQNSALCRGTGRMWSKIAFQTSILVAFLFQKRVSKLKLAN